jgi:two-component system KDP operon response regulator KdpE
MIKLPTILIIDDEPQIRKIVRITLESDGFHIIEADTGKQGLQLAASHNPQLIILDLGLPDYDGTVVLKELRSWSSAAVIVLSVRNSEDDIIKALNTGADDYMTKPFSAGELIARIKANMRRVHEVEGKSVITNGNLTIDLGNRLVFFNKDELKLTNIEYQLLALFFQNIGKVLTKDYIIRTIWGNNALEDPQSLRVFIGLLLKKIEAVPSHPKMIVTESGVGYRMKSIE